MPDVEWLNPLSEALSSPAHSFALPNSGDSIK
jgi:hypothetical protein